MEFHRVARCELGETVYLTQLQLMRDTEFQLRGRTDAGGEAFSFGFDMPYIPDVEDGRSSFVFAVPVTWTDALTSISLVGGDAERFGQRRPAP